MGAEATQQAGDFVIGQIGRSYLRFERPEVVPAGTRIIVVNDLTQMTKEELEDMYATIAGVSPKRFKSPTMAMENVVYLIGKMPFSDPETAEADVVAAEAAAAVAIATGKPAKKYQRKSPNTYTLLLSKESEKAIQTLAPQARECVGIMVDLAKELGKLEFTEVELKARFDVQSDRLRTKQGTWRILQYYRSKLIAADLLRVS